MSMYKVIVVQAVSETYKKKSVYNPNTWFIFE